MSFQTIALHNAARLASVAQIRLGFITDVAWSAGGRVMGVAHGTEISLWEGGFGGAPTRVLTGHHAPVKALAFVDGKQLASASADTTVRLWKVETGEERARYGTDASVDSIAANASGTIVAAGSSQGQIRLWNVKTGVEQSLPGHEQKVGALAFHPFGVVLASGGQDAATCLWDPITGTRIAKWTEHAGGVRDLAFSPDGHVLASASRDSTVHLRDVRTGQQTASLAHQGDSRAVAFTRDGAVVASGDLNTLCLWNAETGALLARLEGHVKPILSLALHPHGHLLVSASGDNTLRLWGIRA